MTDNHVPPEGEEIRLLIGDHTLIIDREPVKGETLIRVLDGMVLSRGIVLMDDERRAFARALLRETEK